MTSYTFARSAATSDGAWAELNCHVGNVYPLFPATTEEPNSEKTWSSRTWFTNDVLDALLLVIMAGGTFVVGALIVSDLVFA